MIKLVNRLGAQKVLPVTFSITNIPLDIQIPYQPLYGRDGAVKTGKTTMLPRQFTLQGTIIHRSRAETRQELDLLLSFLMQPPIEVYRHHEDTRFLRAHPVGAPHDWMTGGAEVQLRVPMIALDPYWYGPEVTVAVSGTQAVEVDGSAPTHPIITSIGSVTSLIVTNQTTGKKITVTGAGAVIEVDTLDYVVNIGGQASLDKANDDWLLYGFELIPGTNQIATNTPIMLTYSPRWW